MHGNEVRVRKRFEALEVLRRVATKTGDDPTEVSLYSLRIGAATPRAAGREMPPRAI